MMAVKFLIQWTVLNLLIVGVIQENANASWATERRHLNDKEILILLEQPATKRKMLDGFKNGPKVCNMNKEPFAEMSVEKLKSMATAASANNKFCEEAFLWSEIRRQYPVKPYYRESWLMEITALVKANDYIEVINKGNDFIDEFRVDDQIQEVRFLINMAVIKGMRATFDDVDQQWNRYALGIEQGQGLNEAYLDHLILKSFLRDFPTSPYANTVESWLQEARDRYASFNLMVAKNYIKDGEYYAAILRLKFNLQYGIVANSFAESMYEMVRAHVLFSEILENPKKLKDKRLRDWLAMEESQTLDRSTLSEQTLKQAFSFLKIMEEQLPNSKWTEKAQVLLEQTK